MRRYNKILILTAGLILLTCSLYGQRLSTIVIRSLDETDTLAKFLDVIDLRTPIDVRNKHKEIWKIEEVRKLALKYGNDHSIVFTRTEDEKKFKRSICVIGLYSLVGEDETKLETYRIKRTSKIERWNSSSSKWDRLSIIN